jgi:hypothetical protein
MTFIPLDQNKMELTMKTKFLTLLSLVALLAMAACNTSPGAPKIADMSLETINPVPTPESLIQNVNFHDDLNTDISKDWGLKIISGLEKQLIWSQEDGHFRLELLPGNNTNFAFINKGQNFKDVVVQAEVRYLESSAAFVSVICRASDKGWYEFRINSQGYYEVLKFDQYLKDQGKNAYTDLVGGQLRSPLVKTGKEINRFALSCNGNQLTAFVNNEQLFKDRRPLVITDTSFSEGTVGFGVAGNGKSADLSFSYVETLKP